MQYIKISKDYSLIDPVFGNANHFQQIFVNLIINAVDAMNGKGDLMVKVFQQEGCAKVVIQDTGCGIKQEDLPFIFDPFFTTKDPGKGTGLGLNVVYRLINQYKGKIQVKTKKGEGTEFHLTFPMGIASHEGEGEKG